MVGDVAVVAPPPAIGTTWIGRALPRLEDQRLVLGQGEYTDDITIAGELHAVIVRSPFAHARIRRIDVAEAYASAGVLGVYTGLDYQNDGRGPIHQNPMPDDNLDGGRPAFSAEEGALLVDVPQQVLAVSEVFHQGEAVVMVVADTKAHALDAAELVNVSYDELPVIVEIDQALAPNAVQLVPSAPNNIVVDAQRGDGEATERAFAGAAAIVEGEFHNQRIFSAHMEPRSALATYDSAKETFDVVCGGGGSVRYRRVLGTALKVPIESIQVRTPDVGGSFGSRNNLHPEVVLVAWAAMRLGRAVRWTSTRSDGFLTDFPGRDMHVKSELALTADGKILALRAFATANVGAYTISYAFLNNYSRIAPSVYDIPAADIHVRALLTNTTPLTVYRGAGRPEAMFVIERLLDLAAAKLGLSRLEIRRRNIIKVKPYTSATGLTYDSGDFTGNMQRALDLADWDGFPLRRAESASRNRLRGIGLANYVEAPTGFPRERVVINVLPEGVVEVLIGTQSSGQSHETTFAQIVAELLDVPIRSIRLVQGDTRRVDVGGGTHPTARCVWAPRCWWKLAARSARWRMPLPAARRATCSKLRKRRRLRLERTSANGCPPILPAARCARSKSIHGRVKLRRWPTRRSTMPDARSTRWYCTVKRTAGLPRAWAKRLWRRWFTTARAAKFSAVRSWATPCRERGIFHRCRPN